MADKQRLDVLMVERGLAPSREKARAMIMAGEVRIADQVIDKPGTRVDAAAEISVQAALRFVSRGGDKLAAALDAFPVRVEGRICADVGASTGGFTDCLLQRGAAHIYAIDVGYGQLDYRLRQDSRVTVMERTNARYVERLPQPVSLVVVDASFISMRLLLPVIAGWFAESGEMIALIKPQFEAGRQDVGKGGVVRSAAVHRRVLADTLSFAQLAGYSAQGLIRSPLLGPAGNIEFLVWLKYGMPTDHESLKHESLIESALVD